MNEGSSIVESEHSFFAEEKNKGEIEQNKVNIDFSKNSSNPEGIFDTLNREIRYAVETCKDLSYYSNSNSKISEQQQYNEQFLDSRFWWVKKNQNDNDSFNAKNEIMEKRKDSNNNNIKNNKAGIENNKKNEKESEEKIIYVNDEDEKNNFNDDFDIEDMEEKTIEKSENDINEINSIKVNNNNLNNKNKDNQNNKEENVTTNDNDNITNKSKPANEADDRLLPINDKLNASLTPNKITQSFFPCIYNNQQVHSFISTFNKYPSTFTKGSFISTNNSSNNKCKKDEDHCSSGVEEEIINNNKNEDIKTNNNNTYNHGNKFGPHLNTYNQLPNNNNIANINMDTTNMQNMNGMSFNMNNNFLYNRIPKMNLNMVYYIPVQQQQMSPNINYINNNKMFSNLNNIIKADNNINIINGNNNTNNQSKENIASPNSNNNITNTNENKAKKNSSSEDKNKNKTSNISNLLNNNNNNNNFKNNNNNFKNNGYRKNDNNNNLNSNQNINNNNANSNNNQCNKGEKNLLNLDDIVTGKDTRTTVMIRNIPIKYTDDILIEALEEFKGKYDCLYMPFDYEKKGNKGYAFINFVNPLHILYFHEKFYGKKWPLFESSKICELNSANFQGIYEIQKHSKNYKGYKKPLFYSEKNNNKDNDDIEVKMIIPSKYLFKLKIRFPNMKYHENKAKKIITVDSFE